MKPTALVVGATLAGLTTAFRLGERGYAVTLIEHNGPRGHAPVIDRAGEDDLPLVLMGSDTATRSLLHTLGTAGPAFGSHRIAFELLRADGRSVRLRYSWLPAPLHIVAGLASFPGLPARDRWRFLLWMERTWERDPALPVDLDSHTAEAWLRGIGQSELARARVWTPLSRVLLGDDVKTVSAAALLVTLMRCFLPGRRQSQPAIPLLSRDRLLHRPMRDALGRMGATINTAEADRIIFKPDGVTGVQLKGGNTLEADWYIIALPHRQVTPLLPERVLTRFSYFQHIDALVDTPAVAVHLWIDQRIQAPRLILLAERTFHWICLKPAADPQHTVASLVATGHSEWFDWPDKDLLNTASEDLHVAIPALSKASRPSHRIICESRAFLAMRPGTTARRPLQRSPFPNLLLAGEWTDTGLPPTVESAIVSGNRCAQTVADQARG